MRAQEGLNTVPEGFWGVKLGRAGVLRLEGQTNSTSGPDLEFRSSSHPLFNHNQEEGLVPLPPLLYLGGLVGFEASSGGAHV